MNPFWAGKGRNPHTGGEPFPFLFESPPIQPAMYLFANLSLIIFSLTLSCCRWGGMALIWSGVFLLAALNVPRPLHTLKKSAYALPFLGISLFFHLFYTPGSILFRIGPLLATREGLSQGCWITQKLAFLFCASLVLISGTPGTFPFQLAGRLSHLPLLRRARIRTGILILFLILRWLRILPWRWKKQIQEQTDMAKGKRGKLILGLKALPGLIGQDLSTLDRWLNLFISRGYAEGILRIADASLPPCKWLDIVTGLGTVAAWGYWIISRF